MEDDGSPWTDIVVNLVICSILHVIDLIADIEIGFVGDVRICRDYLYNEIPQDLNLFSTHL